MLCSRTGLLDILTGMLDIFELEAAAAALAPASFTTFTHSLSLFLVFLVLSRCPTNSLSFSI
jgi:hypothetical protein